MHRYTDINKKPLFVNKRSLIPVKKTKRRTYRYKTLEKNYQIRYYLLIFIFIFSSFLYIAIQISNKNDSIFTSLYTILLKSNPIIPEQLNFKEKEPLASVTKEVSDTSALKREEKTSTTQPLPISPPSQIISIFLPKFSTKKNSINFITVPKRITYQREKDIYALILKELVTYKSGKNIIKNFFSSQIRLNDLYIEGETLILDFNRFFEVSKYGYKGLDIRLQQILWTYLNLKISDSQEKINFVSILINGERKERLGGDGIILKPFYSRKDLKNKIVFN